MEPGVKMVNCRGMPKRNCGRLANAFVRMTGPKCSVCDVCDFNDLEHCKNNPNCLATIIENYGGVPMERKK